ncbi:uncharacterized protein DUF1579 [Herbihabitans rhizosphaerae]|uniref:Uncharacterized protein DUF1579 n=1 Tax=Herbihabitans rhizosphaerae TaxID=1872711 RepID=A0A4Q7L8A5_9PSEU|nr:DUF1579 family protein [Herbihabitans rhizosphaerae]RZS44881.1 uncharacterized protein DUF1579 [Herbihabitans rhizosphaerae]
MANSTPGMPTPHPALKRLDHLVGTWTMTGNLIGSDEETITGTATYTWLPGGFFLVQEVEIDFAGMVNVRSHELIGYDPETDTFPSTVYSNMAPEPLPYRWTVREDGFSISVTHGVLDATYTGTFSADGTSMSGGWRPNPGADETVNISYDVRGTRA